MKSWTSRPLPELPGTAPALRLMETRTGTVQNLPASASAALYVCGVTPYDATHMGHAATYVAFDLLNRFWRDAGVEVSYVQNVTDVDDPLLERATRDGVDWRELAREQTALLHQDMEALNVLAPEYYIGAVESIERIVPEVEKLIASGLAYRVAGGGGEPDGDVYFDTTAASTAQHRLTGAWWLGQISGLDAAGMMELFAERGGDPDRPGKRHALDPLLWRTKRDGEPSWPGSALGEGRPGWHIECTVIAQQYLPAPLTVQGGGSDLIFPHHEMGAGHAYALTGTELARHYAHTGMVGLDGEKMSKSKGNLVLVSQLRAAGVEAAAIRLAILANHYRADWYWTDQLLEQAQARLAAWRKALDVAPAGSAPGLIDALRSTLADDLDAPAALGATDDWAAGAVSGHGCSAADAQLVRDGVNALLGVIL